MLSIGDLNMKLYATVISKRKQQGWIPSSKCKLLHDISGGGPTPLWAMDAEPLFVFFHIIVLTIGKGSRG